MAAKWLDAAGVGEVLGLSAKTVRERVALRQDFPVPLRIGGVARPRWREDEVAEWAERERQRNAGRQRAAA
jgi:predicted DNA-binding transcriptional regulator AlpA